MVKIISTENTKTFNNKHMLKIFKAAAIKFPKGAYLRNCTGFFRFPLLTGLPKKVI